ncbi:MAG: SGNH/GDSL hydrolase family protein [Bacteroidota bacterium]
MRLLPLLILLMLCTCGSTNDDDMPTPIPPGAQEPAPTPLRYLALGDSYTIGEDVAEQDRWPNQLARELGNSDFPVGEVQFVATTGWTTDALDNGMNNADLTPPYDLVSLLIGVNDQFRGFDVATYRPKLENLVNRAIEQAGGDTSRVFIVSIPDYAFTPFGNGRESITNGVNAYNAVKAQVANDYGLPYINITPISRQGLDRPELVAQDGLHPSGEQYRLWVQEEIRRVVVTMLE